MSTNQPLNLITTEITHTPDTSLWDLQLRGRKLQLMYVWITADMNTWSRSSANCYIIRQLNWWMDSVWTLVCGYYLPCGVDSSLFIITMILKFSRVPCFWCSELSHQDLLVTIRYKMSCIFHIRQTSKIIVEHEWTVVMQLVHLYSLSNCIMANDVWFSAE